MSLVPGTDTPPFGPSGSPALVLSRVGAAVCLYCTACHKVKVEFGPETLALGPDEFHELLTELEVAHSDGGDGSLPCWGLSGLEGEVLADLLRQARRSLIMALLLRER